jgi:hypothetical protein
MKSMLMAIMAVAVLVAFSAPSFAEDAPKDKKKEVEKPKFSQMLNADSDKDKKDDKKKEEKK